MNYDYPKLRVPIFLFLLTALCLSIAWKGERLPDWLRLFLTAAGLTFAVWGLFSAFDWLSHIFAERL
jgi:hypothetical protein